MLLRVSNMVLNSKDLPLNSLTVDTIQRVDSRQEMGWETNWEANWESRLEDKLGDKRGGKLSNMGGKN